MAKRAFLLPDPGEGIEEAEVVAWLVAEGDVVELNQPFVEVETAKATVEIPSPYAGRVARLHAAAGETVRVGDVLVTFDADEPEGGEPHPSLGRRAPIPATPKARRLAKEMGIDLESVSGSGPGGRIEVEDVEQASGMKVGGRADASEETSVPVTGVRRAIANRLSLMASVPQVTTFRTVDCTDMEALRDELAVSPLPILVAALARTCREHPMINASWGGEAIDVYPEVNVGVATETERGLMVPVVRAAHRLGIKEISAAIDRLAAVARDGSITPAELTGSTISVSNTGSYGSESGTPLLNPGNAVTLALGVIAPRALVVDGAVVARPACTLSLTFDHRVLDGATVGRALTDLVSCLQEADRLRDLPR